jgi:DNA-binding transcriptional MerR regulator
MTVRHYHQLGLIQEPHRDGSGYRRDRSTDRLRLVQVRTLAGASVPLAEIEGLLEDPEYVRLTKRSWVALAWTPDAPRIDELASAPANSLLTNDARLAMPTSFGIRSDAATRYSLINHHRENQSPTGARLTALVEAHLRAAGAERLLASRGQHRLEAVA